ncbi:MAG: GNAT family N-acetyltransferase [Pseudomonadota bacterium]
MITRALTGEDHLAWRALRLEGLRLYPNAFLLTLEEAEARPTDADAAMLDQGNFIGVFDDKMVAMAALRSLSYEATAHWGEIGPFYVSPAAQGGAAARVLMEALVERATQKGIWQLELFVADDNARAKRFYEREGFQSCGALPNAALVNGVLTSDIFMTRDLRR